MSTKELAPALLNILLVEDNADDAALLEMHLRRSGFRPQITRVETEGEMLAALSSDRLPSIVLADYNLPAFSGPQALHLLRSRKLDIPFIMLSGAISEETAVVSMRAGAQDYVSKQNLARLVPAIQRELDEAVFRRDRLAAERALRESELRFHSLIEAMPLGLLISDVTGQVTFANRAAERLLGYTQADLASGALRLGSICPSLTKAFDDLVRDSAAIEPTEAACIGKDSKAIESLIAVTALMPEAKWERRQLATFIADLSLQKQSEETLRRTEKLAVTGRLAAAIAHEINNPLEAVTNCLYLVAQTDLPQDGRKYLDLAQRELDRVTKITIQTLRFFRGSTRPATVDVHDLIDNVLLLLDSRFRHCNVEVVRQFRATSRIHAQEGELQQVVANLVGNAVDAVVQGGCVVIRTSNSRDWKSGRQGLTITVADNGIGMDPATRQRIFEPFFSTKGSTGTGLGLWISQEIIAKHEGNIQVRTRPQRTGRKGTTVFRVFLPFPAS